MDFWLLSTFWLSLLIPLQAVTRCVNAPSPAKRIFCEQLHRWDLGAGKSPTSSEVPSESQPRLTDDDSVAKEIDPYQCRDLECLCEYMKGKWHPCDQYCSLPNNQMLVKSFRREYRTLCNEERQRLHSAFRILKQNGEFDKLATIYSQHSQSGGAHSGPAYLPWHREFLKRLEIALRLIDAELSLPYWDSTLDSHLQTPEDSILWSNELMGSSDENGTVLGEFAGWKVPQGNRMLRRNVGCIGKPLDVDDINHIASTTKVDDILAFTAPKKGCVYPTNYQALEYAQGSVQIFVGGDMMDLATAANDPVFYMHQAFIDLLWEQWRHRVQADRA